MMVPIIEPRRDIHFNDYDADLAFSCEPVTGQRSGVVRDPDGPRLVWNAGKKATRWETILHIRLKAGHYKTLDQAQSEAPAMLAKRLRELADILDSPERFQDEGEVSDCNMDLLG